MPQIGWIDALRQWNAGSPSWCIPRKGTAAYDSIMRIRRGEPEKSVRERVQELEAKSPKQKKERKTIRVKLTAEPPMENNVDKTQQKMNGISKTNSGSPRGVEAMATGKNQASPMGGAGGPARGGGGSSSATKDKLMAKLGDYKYDVKAPELLERQFEDVPAMAPIFQHIREYMTRFNAVRKNPVRNVKMNIYQETDWETYTKAPTGTYGYGGKPTPKTDRIEVDFEYSISKVNEAFHGLVTYIVYPNFEVKKEYTIKAPTQKK